MTLALPLTWTRSYPLAVRAIRFAEQAHEGQYRKYTGEPYVNHCLDVMMRLCELYSKHGLVCPDYMLAAAALHDTVEDTEVSFQQLTEMFGEDITGLVFWLTDNEPKTWGNRATRKRLAAERISNAPFAAKVIKWCDIASNTNSIVENDPKFAAVYVPEKCRILELIGEFNRDDLAYSTMYTYEAVK